MVKPAVAGGELLHVLHARHGKEEEMGHKRERINEFTWDDGVAGWWSGWWHMVLAGDVGGSLADGTRCWLEMLVVGREEACSGNEEIGGGDDCYCYR